MVILGIGFCDKGNKNIRKGLEEDFHVVFDMDLNQFLLFFSQDSRDSIALEIEESVKRDLTSQQEKRLGLTVHLRLRLVFNLIRIIVKSLRQACGSSGRSLSRFP